MAGVRAARSRFGAIRSGHRTTRRPPLQSFEGVKDPDLRLSTRPEFGCILHAEKETTDES